MNSILKMKNSILNYAWGSRTAIAQLMDRPFPTENPEAELWLGAHPKSPSSVWVKDRWWHLDQWIAQDPDTILGIEISTRFNGALPYLLKILAAAQPLSIQAHPNKAQANKGFEKEKQLNIPIDAIHRNYKDSRHKPECICAITPFWALCGFRKNSAVIRNLEGIWPDGYRTGLDIIETSGIKGFFRHLLLLDDKTRLELIRQVIQNVASSSDPSIIERWMVRLHNQYPGDAGVLSPAFLNLIQLQPGEALALKSGQLHAYLEGLGIEVMANSDNVLRGGLTPKHIDVHELLDVIECDSYSPDIMTFSTNENHERIYPSHAEEFVLSVIKTTQHRSYVAEKRVMAPEILLCTKGEAHVVWQNGSNAISVAQGHSVFVTAAVGQYSIEGDAVIYKAGVNVEL